jgi:hypothetical protein
MPFDHYVSQVHLKNFNSPALDGKLYAIRKSDLKRFQTKPRDICRIEDGSTNAYLTESRAIEDFLKDVEPRYNASVAKLREHGSGEHLLHCRLRGLHHQLFTRRHADSFGAVEGDLDLYRNPA